QQHRFRHDVSTYHITIKRLGAAKMYQEMDNIVNQVLAIPCIGNEALYNTIIYFFVEARKLSRAVNIFKHMRNRKNLGCRPSIRTYNSLFTALLSRRSDFYINFMYVETIRCLFRQIVNDGIEPDIFLLNTMIKGYVLALQINDALRIFHQMGVVYDCQPNSFSYNYLIHGLCSQGRTRNARELSDEMKKKGFVPSGKSYNSLVNALALNGETEEAVIYLWEMIEKQRLPDFISYKTVLDEICRRDRVEEALRLLKELQEKVLVDGHTYRKILFVLEHDYGYSSERNRFRQMVNDGIEPDIFSLNTMIKGYVLALQINDALRIFHQMGVVYDCQPNSFSYNYLIHGLCSQGRTRNARELSDEMKKKGFVPSGKSYNSLVNALALNGETEEAVNYLWEMIEKQRLPDFITYKTVLDEICRRDRVEEALRLLKELQEKDL
ncbi:PPR domain-containing protein/PPR_2 domain-containing protein, partial [Cephalotus follicularis]